MENKNVLRENFFKIRSKLKKEEVKKISYLISDSFFSLDLFKNRKKILIYHSIRNEIITHDLISELLDENMEVFLPYISDDKKELLISKVSNNFKLKSGVFGIKEPLYRQNVPVSDMDIIIVPGLLFDRNGYRIGYGGGYYDRLLSGINDNIITIGFVYDDFLQDSLPINKHDMPVKIIITEKQILYIGGVED